VADFLNLPLRNESGAYNVVVEAPRGYTVKLKYEPLLNAFVFKRPLLLGVAYPYDWGFFPSTCAEDGDPLDAMVLFDTPTSPGVIVPSTPIGIVRVVQREKGKKGRTRNDRLIVVPVEDKRFEHVRELSGRVVRELEEFFVTASRMAGKTVEIEGWKGPNAAKRAIEAAANRYIERGVKKDA